MPRIFENLTGDATLLDAILSFAAIVVVPLALNLIHDRPSTRQMIVTIATGVLLSIALLVPGGVWPTAMAVPWLLVTAGLLPRAVIGPRFLAAPNLGTVTKLMAHAFLVIGAVWSVLACGGWTVLGFDPVIVQLTAIHFHYAGFALVVLAAKAAEATPGLLANASITIVVVGVPAVAAGISFRSIALQWWATLWLAGGCALVSALPFSAATTVRTPAARTLLAVSAASLLAGMGLAVAYAAGRQYDYAGLDIPTMIRTHGLIQSLGFAFCGLMGWRLTTMAGGAIILRDHHARARSLSAR
jgi:hypothetical protein